MPQPVLDSLNDHILLEARIGGYEAAEKKAKAIENSYESAASFIGAHPDEIAMLDSATRAWNMAFHAIPFEKGDKILLSSWEYVSNQISFNQMVQKKGVKLIKIPNNISNMPLSISKFIT